MKRLVRASKAGRPIANQDSSWRVIHLSIVIYRDNRIESAVTDIDTNDVFFSKMIEHLESADYLPYLSLAAMKKLFHSPYSNSEYYTFLKVDNNAKVKLVLDIRFADHHSPQYGKVSAYDRHKNFMPKGRNANVKQDGFDTKCSQSEFYDIEFYEQPSLKIVIDGKPSYTVKDALSVLDSKIAQLP